MVLPVIAEHIETTTGVCGGKPRITGHRIRVEEHRRLARASRAFARRDRGAFPQLTLGDVYAALAYYHNHGDAIRQSMRGTRGLRQLRSGPRRRRSSSRS